MVIFLEIFIKKQFLRTIFKKLFSIIFKNKILFKNSNMKDSFLDLFSIKVLYTYVCCKCSRSILCIQLLPRILTKNNWKHLKFILKNNLFLKKIIRKLLSVTSLSNVLSKVITIFPFKEHKTIFTSMSKQALKFFTFILENEWILQLK